MFNKIAHVAYIVSDMEKSMDFYCGVLGFERVFDIKDENEDPWIVYLKVGNGQFIELFYSKEHFTAEPMWKQRGFSHLCLEVADINAAAELVRSMGVKLAVEPSVGKDGNSQFWLQDPDGNAVEIMQIHPDSLQAPYL